MKSRAGRHPPEETQKGGRSASWGSCRCEYLSSVVAISYSTEIKATCAKSGDKGAEKGRQYVAVHDAEERASLACEFQLPSMTERITGLIGDAGGEKLNHSNVEPPAPRVGAPGT